MSNLPKSVSKVRKGSPSTAANKSNHSPNTQIAVNYQPKNLITMSSSSEKSKTSKSSDSSKSQKRGWEPWSGKEIQVFFESLERFGRDFEQIQQSVGTKHYQQVRHFYYRLLKKINKIVEPSGLAIDKKNPTEISQALHCYWEVKKKMSLAHPEMEGEGNSTLTAAQTAEFNKHFLALVQSNIITKRGDVEQKQPFRSISNPDVHYSSSLGSFPESNPQLTLQLLPRTEDINNYISSLSHNPKLQITLAHDKHVSYVIQHLIKKWGDRSKLPHSFRLYPLDDKIHKGWGESDSIPLRFICSQQGNYSLLKFSYDWDTITKTPSTSTPTDLPHFRSLTLPTPTASSSSPNLPSSYNNLLKKPASSTSSPTLSDLYRTMLSQSTSPILSSDSTPSKSSENSPLSEPESIPSKKDTPSSLQEVTKSRSFPGTSNGSNFGAIVNTVLIDEISCDGFESTETVCDSDEMDCKKFYSTFESNDSNSCFEQNDSNSNSNSNSNSDLSLLSSVPSTAPPFKKPRTG
eukprot:TRINITY_DN1316_c0_g1_i1.p1 TRINITY_DN1316_c0_g1~~TRINITY_DN1316_c0_g1_i1.p1  ORF type:complete len:518 (+),score=103.51 TRINITY_DN1316_c0_g1_i1:150-1703(+)